MNDKFLVTKMTKVYVRCLIFMVYIMVNLYIFSSLGKPIFKTFYESSIYIQKSIHIIRVQHRKFSVAKHIHVGSISIKKQILPAPQNHSHLCLLSVSEPFKSYHHSDLFCIL